MRFLVLDDSNTMRPNPHRHPVGPGHRDVVAVSNGRVAIDRPTPRGVDMAINEPILTSHH